MWSLNNEIYLIKIIGWKGKRDREMVDCLKLKISGTRQDRSKSSNFQRRQAPSGGRWYNPCASGPWSLRASSTMIDRKNAGKSKKYFMFAFLEIVLYICLRQFSLMQLPEKNCLVSILYLRMNCYILPMGKSLFMLYKILQFLELTCKYFDQIVLKLV